MEKISIEFFRNGSYIFNCQKLAPEQLLASKLGSWRGIKDRLDAFQLMKEFKEKTKEQVWNEIEAYLTPHQELKSQMAFDELWERLK